MKRNKMEEPETPNGKHGKISKLLKQLQRAEIDSELSSESDSDNADRHTGNNCKHKKALKMINVMTNERKSISNPSNQAENAALLSDSDSDQDWNKSGISYRKRIESGRKKFTKGINLLKTNVLKAEQFQLKKNKESSESDIEIESIGSSSDESDVSDTLIDKFSKLHAKQKKSTKSSESKSDTSSTIKSNLNMTSLKQLKKSKRCADYVSKTDTIGGVVQVSKNRCPMGRVGMILIYLKMKFRRR